MPHGPLARKTHLDKGRIATAVWGRAKFAVSSDAAETDKKTSALSCPDLSVELLAVTGSSLSETTVAGDGEFTFDIDPASIDGEYLALVLRKQDQRHARYFRFDSASIPEFQLTIPSEWASSGQ